MKQFEEFKLVDDFCRRVTGGHHIVPLLDALEKNDDFLQLRQLVCAERGSNDLLDENKTRVIELAAAVATELVGEKDVGEKEEKRDRIAVVSLAGILLKPTLESVVLDKNTDVTFRNCSYSVEDLLPKEETSNSEDSESGSEQFTGEPMQRDRVMQVNFDLAKLVALDPRKQETAILDTLRRLPTSDCDIICAHGIPNWFVFYRDTNFVDSNDDSWEYKTFIVGRYNTDKCVHLDHACGDDRFYSLVVERVLCAVRKDAYEIISDRIDLRPLSPLRVVIPDGDSVVPDGTHMACLTNIFLRRRQDKSLLRFGVLGSAWTKKEWRQRLESIDAVLKKSSWCDSESVGHDLSYAFILDSVNAQTIPLSAAASAVPELRATQLRNLPVDPAFSDAGMMLAPKQLPGVVSDEKEFTSKWLVGDLRPVLYTIPVAARALSKSAAVTSAAASTSTDSNGMTNDDSENTSDNGNHIAHDIHSRLARQVQALSQRYGLSADSDALKIDDITPEHALAHLQGVAESSAFLRELGLL